MPSSQVIAKQSFNKFALCAMAIAAVHLGYIFTKTELVFPLDFFPLAIDAIVLLIAFATLILSSWIIEKFPFGRAIPFHDLISTMTFFALGISAFSMLVYTAYTGDRFNIALASYFIEHPVELFAPIVAETGYISLFIVASLSILSGLVLHQAHRLSARHLLVIFLASTLGILLTSNYVVQKDSRIYAFFSPGGQARDLPPIEGQSVHTPPWFKSFYLSIFNWNEQEFSLEEEASPTTKYAFTTHQPQEGNRPNIVLLVLESIRASSTSPYDHSPEIVELTPNLKRFAQSGILVEHAYTTIPHTSKALVGIFCGQFPPSKMEIIEAQPGGLPIACLPKLLTTAGYQTAFFQSAHGNFEDRHGLTRNMGFQQTFTQERLINHSKFKKVGYVGMDDYVMLDPAINWMKAKAKKGNPFFVGMLTVVSHHPYITPDKTDSKNTIESTPIDVAYTHYLSSVSYTDRFLGDLISQMDKSGLMKNTIVIITGDHGEAFAEHGPTFHNSTPHEEGMKVPLVLYSPELLPVSKRVTGLRSHLDLLPTLLDITGHKVLGNLPGKSLFASEGHESIAGACWYTEHCAVLYRSNGEKFIYWRGRKPNEYFNVSKDPKETRNLIHTIKSDEETKLVHSLFTHLNNYQTVYQDSTH